LAVLPIFTLTAKKEPDLGLAEAGWEKANMGHGQNLYEYRPEKRSDELRPSAWQLKAHSSSEICVFDRNSGRVHLSQLRHHM